MERVLVSRASVVASGVLALSGCETPDAVSSASNIYAGDGVSVASTATETEQKITDVTQALMALGSGVDPREAARAAQVAVRDPLQWAQAWRIDDPPLVHNFKVVNGVRDKGVCQDFANAMHAALQAEGLQTLQIHRAMANAHNLLLEHATVILTARGQPMEQGVVLDPWRLGYGQLWFGRVAEDNRYDWESLADVHAKREAARAGL